MIDFKNIVSDVPAIFKEWVTVLCLSGSLVSCGGEVGTGYQKRLTFSSARSIDDKLSQAIQNDGKFQLHSTAVR